MAGLRAQAAVHAGLEIADQMLLGLLEERLDGGVHVDWLGHDERPLADTQLQQLFAVRIDDVHGAGNAGIEAVDGAQDLERLLGIGERVAPSAPPRTRRAGPSRRAGPAFQVLGHHGLVVGDLAVLDDDPVSQRAARRLHVADARAPRSARSTGPTRSSLNVRGRRP